MKKTGHTGIDLLIDICKHPNKYNHVMNVPAWGDAALTLIELGYKPTLKQRPIYLRRGLHENRSLSIGTEAVRELNMN